MPKPDDAFVTLAKVDGGVDILAHPRSPLTWRQKYIPLDATLKRLGTKRPAGANRFRAPALNLPGGGAGFPTAPVKDHFAAAQFFDVTEQDRLQCPSFENYDAGVSVAVDSFDAGLMAVAVAVAVAVESFAYEEKNLSSEDDSVVNMLHLGLMVDNAWMYAFGAAARSELRERLQPKVLAKVAVAPAAYQVTDRATAKAVGVAAST